MEEKLAKVKEILKEQNQEQILNYPSVNHEELIDKILTINFEQLNRLYAKSIKKEEVAEAKVEPISCVDKQALSIEERENYEKIGEKIIKEGKYAVVTMAGGQGTRLGHNGPKGTFDFGLESHKSIFEVLCDNLKEGYEKYNVYVPWYIMTSKQNSEETIAFFEEKNYFGYPKENIYFFKQGELPILNEAPALRRWKLVYWNHHRFEAPCSRP